MLQAPISDRKTKAEASSKTASDLPEYEPSSQSMGGIGRSRQSQPLQQRENLAALQKAYGNQAVLRMKGRSSAANPLQGGVLQRKCACGNTAGSSGSCAECQNKQEDILQTKLQIGEAGDRYEQEADRVAEQVVQMPEPTIQYQVEPEAISDSITPLQRRSADRDRISEVPPIVNEVLNSPGQPLDSGTQKFMESRFGHDFSQVRVYTDAKADESSRAIGASAYTVQDRIVFAHGNYAPESTCGRQLLAHELTHVVQQSAPLVQRQVEPDTINAIPLYTIKTDSIQVPQGREGRAGSIDTDTFFIPLSITVRVTATASYIGSSTNVSDWSVQLFRSPWWGADEPIGTRHVDRVGNTIRFSVFPPDAPTRSYYLRFRNASQYEPISVSYNVTS
jgi:Domain of unknown function (DUF4157)